MTKEELKELFYESVDKRNLSELAILFHTNTTHLTDVIESKYFPKELMMVERGDRVSYVCSPYSKGKFRKEVEELDYEMVPNRFSKIILEGSYFTSASKGGVFLMVDDKYRVKVLIEDFLKMIKNSVGDYGVFRGSYMFVLKGNNALALVDETEWTDEMAYALRKEMRNG